MRESAERTVAEVERLGGRGMPLEVDVSLAESLRGMADAVVERYGRIDVLVNNAGFGFAATVVETEEDDWGPPHVRQPQGGLSRLQVRRAGDGPPGRRIDSEYGLGSGASWVCRTGPRTAPPRAV